MTILESRPVTARPEGGSLIEQFELGLDESPDVRGALRAAGVPEEQWAAYADALRGLAATDMIRPRDAEVAA